MNQPTRDFGDRHSQHHDTRLALALDATQSGIWDFRVQDGTFVGTAHLYKMLGEEPVDGEDSFDWFLERLHVDDYQKTLAAIDAAQQDDAIAYRTEFRLKHVDGSYRWILSSGRVVERDAEGRAIRMIGHHVDIHDAKTTDLQIRDALHKEARNQRLIKEIFQHVPACIAIFDTDMRFLAVSRRWIDTYRIAHGNIIGQSVYDVMPGIPEKWRKVHERCLRGASERCDEDYWRMPNGEEHWERWEVLPWYQTEKGDIGGITIFSEDISQRKCVEDELDAQREQLADVTRIALLDQYGIHYAHELKHPLSEIQFYSKAAKNHLRDRVESDHPALVYLDGICDAADHAAEFITTIPQAGIDDIGERNRVTVNQLIESSIRLIQARILANGVTIDWQPTDLESAVKCIPIQLQHVFLNLFANALESMIGSGDTQKRIRVAAKGLDNGHIQITVSDTGPGMSKQTVARAFDRFFSTKKDGIGLGLAMCRAIVEAHGGTIDITIRKPVEFRVELPLSGGQAVK